MDFSQKQLQAIESRGKNIMVSASAGSGKTSMLVERLTRLVIQDGISIASILAMTFTEDAAAEMKARLKKALSSQEQTPYMLDQLALLEQADISTIDSFCYKLVQTYYYKIPISYTMSQHVENGPLRQQAFDQAMKRAAGMMDPDDMASLSLYFHAFSASDETFHEAIGSFLAIALSKPDPKQWMNGCRNKDPEVQDWFFTYFQERVEAMLEMCRQTQKWCGTMEFLKIKEQTNIEDLLRSKIMHLERCLNDLKAHEYTAFADHFIAMVESTKRFPKTINKHDCKNTADAYKKTEIDITELLFPQQRLEQDEKSNARIAALFIDLCVLVYELFAQEKKKLEIIDFSDMEHFAYELLLDPLIREEVRSKYEIILVDEFQDTNELQESIIEKIERGNNVFRVGDLKQSIYGFRQAKPAIMQAHIDHVDERNETLFLNENYRSSRSLIEFNNHFYEKIMNTSFADIQFTLQDAAAPGTRRQHEQKQYPVRFLFMQAVPYSAAHGLSLLQAKKLLNAQKADLIAADILRHHALGIPFRSMCILTRSHTPHERLKEVLESYGIPVLAEISHGFYTNQAVQIVLAALQAIFDPHDDVALLGVLCSPLCKVEQQQVAAAGAFRSNDQSLYSVIQDQPFMRAFHALRELRALPVSTLLRHIYNYNGFYYESTNGQDKTNLDLLLEKAVQYPDQSDLEGFVSRIREEADLDKTSEAFPYGKEEDVVKIKTMHHSKGLQFPIVYIWSQHDQPGKNRSGPIRLDEKLGIALSALSEDRSVCRPSVSSIAFKAKKFHDELAEEMRVFYVATTRAEEELIIVDTINSLDDYRRPLDGWALLEGGSYTSWLLHTYLMCPNDLFVLDEVEEISERTEIKKRKNFRMGLQYYQGPVSLIESRTASRAKSDLRWKKVSLKENTRTVRGTLLHEIIGGIPYPFTEENIRDFASRKSSGVTAQDIDQIMALNDSTLFAAWMKEGHEFECAYSVMDHGQMIHGYMDFVAFLEKETIIVDFKSDYVQSMDELRTKYMPQLDVYRKAMRLIDPGKPVRTYIYSLFLKEMSEMRQ